MRPLHIVNLMVYVVNKKRSCGADCSARGAGATSMACGMDLDEDLDEDFDEDFDEDYGDSVDLDRYCGSIAGMAARGMIGVKLFARME